MCSAHPYTTVKTMLDRLVEKRAVSKSKRGNVGLYEPLVSRRQARGTALRMLLDQAFDGAFGPMMHFLAEDEDLSAGERKELIEILSKKSGMSSAKLKLGMLLERKKFVLFIFFFLKKMRNVLLGNMLSYGT